VRKDLSLERLVGRVERTSFENFCDERERERERETLVLDFARLSLPFSFSQVFPVEGLLDFN
jgi:hypothetical protein